MGSGEVFFEMAEKKQLPDFRFLGGAKLALGRGKRRLPEKKLHFGGPRLGGL
jgi:hypothetical protein